MEKTKLFTSILLVTLLSLFVTGCSNDDEEENQNFSEIIGTWRCNYEDGYDLIIFRSNGTGTWTEQSYDYGGSTWNMAYRTDGNKLIITDEEGYVEIYNIAKLSSSLLVLVDEDGDSWTFIRQKQIHQIIIL